MSDWLGLGGQRVLIAGGGGTIGHALVEGFLGAGATVAVIDANTESLAGLASENDNLGPLVTADLREATACRDAVDEAKDALGGIDVFVHAVGINNRKGIEEYTDEEWDAFIAINLSSVFHTAARILPGMRDQGSGRVIFFSSVAGRSGHKLHGPYAATKGAINQLGRVMANEYAEHGVTINSVAPGYMDTELTREYLAKHPEKREALVELIPAKRFGQLEEVVGPVLFLASRQAGFINGQILYIDGGRTVV
jgi:NAD(P)-dependent dehydrogenase (short-subunit alcohol dehydrogenase family)